MTARDNVTTQQVTHAGLTLALAAASANNDVIDTGKVLLVVNNASGAPITVTIHATITEDSLVLADRTVTVAAAATKFIGPLSTSTFGQPASAGADSGRAYVDYSAFASVTRGVYKL